MSFDERGTALIELLEELEVREHQYVLVGGYAVSAFNTRFSTDLDIVVAPETKDEFVSFLDEHEFEEKDSHRVCDPTFIVSTAGVYVHMDAVVLAAGEGTRLRPLTEDKPKGMVEVAGKPILTHCFEQLVELGADQLVVVVGYMKETIIEHYGDEFDGVPITYTHQREQNGLAHALLTAEDHVEDDFMLMLGDNIFQANLEDVVRRHREERADAAFLVEEVPWEEASRYGVCDTNKYGEIVEVVEKPEDPPSNLVMTGFYTFTPAIFHACHLVQPSGRDEYELSDAVDLLLQSGRTIDAIGLEGWRVDVGYPEDRDEAERRLEEGDESVEAEAD